MCGNVSSWHIASFRGDAAIHSLSERSGHSASRAYRTGFMSTRPSYDRVEQNSSRRRPLAATWRLYVLAAPLSQCEPGQLPSVLNAAPVHEGPHRGPSKLDSLHSDRV